MKLVGLFRKVLSESDDDYDGYYDFVNTDFSGESLSSYFLKFEYSDCALCYSKNENNEETYYFMYLDNIPMDYYTDYYESYIDYDDDGDRYRSNDRTGNEELEETGILLYLKHNLNTGEYTENLNRFNDGEFDIIKLTPENERMIIKNNKEFFLKASGHL